VFSPIIFDTVLIFYEESQQSKCHAPHRIKAKKKPRPVGGRVAIILPDFYLPDSSSSGKHQDAVLFPYS
jgi:hypothetical protein